LFLHLIVGRSSYNESDEQKTNHGRCSLKVLLQRNSGKRAFEQRAYRIEPLAYDLLLVLQCCAYPRVGVYLFAVPAHRHLRPTRFEFYDATYRECLHCVVSGFLEDVTTTGSHMFPLTPAPPVSYPARHVPENGHAPGHTPVCVCRGNATPAAAPRWRCQCPTPPPTYLTARRRDYRLRT
jgi:hypothetical protein